jgi:hypothetical protein
LVDAADVCWEFEIALNNNNEQALVFVLGDTTFAPCCIDAIAAQHLEADCVVHYGHACLSPCRDIPVLYSFGRQHLSTQACVEAVVAEVEVKKQKKESDSVQRLLVLYQVCYHHLMEEMETSLREQGLFEQVLFGKIPSAEKRAAAAQGLTVTPGCGRQDCCTSSNGDKSVPTETDASSDTATATATTPLATPEACETDTETPIITAANFVVGGLEIPKDTDWSSFTLLYVGDDTSRQYLNIVLRFLSGSGPAQYWTWQPMTSTLSTVVFSLSAPIESSLLSRSKGSSVFSLWHSGGQLVGFVHAYRGGLAASSHSKARSHSLHHGGG